MKWTANINMFMTVLIGANARKVQIVMRIRKRVITLLGDGVWIRKV